MIIGRREVIHTVGRVPVPGSRVLDLRESLRSSATAAPMRRAEPRVPIRILCAYELCESIGADAVVIQQGEVYGLNRSAHGILMLMGHAPRLGQLIELRIAETWWRSSLNLYEVRWTKPVPVESQSDLFLVGGRLTFGPSHYWTV